MSRWETVKKISKASWPRVIELVDRCHKLATSIRDEQKFMLIAQLDPDQTVEVLEIQALWDKIWNPDDASEKEAR